MVSFGGAISQDQPSILSLMKNLDIFFDWLLPLAAVFALARILTDIFGS